MKPKPDLVPANGSVRGRAHIGVISALEGVVIRPANEHALSA